MKIMLSPSFFGEKEKPLFEHGKMSLSLFKYSTGICGMTLKNARGYITVLPFKGFQVWRACFDGHELVMKTLFDEPTQSTEYCKTYGAFLIHCGLTAIGNPDVAAGDTHPLHAELPNIGYDKAWAVCGEDEKGRYVELCGSCRYVFGFETGYEFRPTYRLYENGTTFDVHNEIENLRGCRQEYSYMCHMNFRPVDGSKLVYSAKTENIYLHELVPDTLTDDEQKKLKDWFKVLKRTFTRTIRWAARNSSISPRSFSPSSMNRTKRAEVTVCRCFPTVMRAMFRTTPHNCLTAFAG